MWGVQGLALFSVRPPNLEACGRAPLPTGCGLGGVWAWGPVTNPTARALASWRCALSGRLEGARGGALLACVWGLRSWALSHSRPLVLEACGRGPLTTGCWCGGCGRGDPSPTSRRELLLAGFARCGGSTRAAGGGASCLGMGRPGLGALPRPTACPWGVRLGPATHWLWVRGVEAWKPCHLPHSARSYELALRAVGAARGRPGGAPLALVWGVLGWALSHA